MPGESVSEQKRNFFQQRSLQKKALVPYGCQTECALVACRVELPGVSFHGLERVYWVPQVWRDVEWNRHPRHHIIWPNEIKGSIEHARTTEDTKLDCGGAEKVACNVTFGGLNWLSPPVPIRARILVVPPLNNLKKKKKTTGHSEGFLVDHKSIKRYLFM